MGAKRRKLDPLDKTILERMYVNQGRSKTDIAKTLGVGFKRVTDSLAYHEIQDDGRPRAKLATTFVPAADVQRFYVEYRWSITRIAKYFNVNHTRISSLLDELEIPRRQSLGFPLRSVDHLEDVVVRKTMIGRAITKKVAILTCGHKSPILQRMTSKPIPPDFKIGCKVCPQEDSDHE